MIDLKDKIYNDIISNTNLLVTDTNNNIVYASNNLLDLYGYTINEILGQKPTILKHHDTLDIFENIWLEINNNHFWTGILKNIKKNGEPIYIKTEIFKDFDDNMRHVGFHAIQIDITKSIQTPHKYIFDNNFFDIFLSDKNDELLIISLTNNNKILEISNKLLNLLNIQDIYNKTFIELIYKKSKYYNNFELLFNDYKTDNNLIIPIHTINGLQKFKINIIEFMFQDIPAVIFKLTDVTKEIQYSLELEEINRSKNDFLANFSHEIRTPLNASIGFLTLLQLKEENKDKLDYIRIILDNSIHLLDMMNNIIDFTTIDNKKVEIIPREFTSKDIQSTIEIFYAKCLEKSINLSVYISPQLPELMSQDIVRIKQIISNLLSNAIKFVDINGAISIDVHHQNNNLYFSIIDNGIGMSDKQIKKIFKPFTQASKDTEYIYGGSGLGLSVVYNIINMMHGEISVNSVLNKGSEFIIKIPINILKDKKILGKINIDNILVFNHVDGLNHSLNKYLMQFTDANIEYINDLNQIDLIQNEVIIFFYEPSYIGIVEILAKYNKIILIKKINELGTINNKNIIEITAPILGSDLFDALNRLIVGISVKPNNLNDMMNLNIKGKLLIADDLESNRILLYETLSQYDLTLDLVTNGKEVFDYYQESIINNKSFYNIIILDMNMPILNGFKTAKKIREFEKKYNIIKTPIMALTANRYYDSKENNKYLTDMDEYLTKPINLKQFLLTIIKYTANIEVDINLNYQYKLEKLKEIKNKFINRDNDINALIYTSETIFSTNEFNDLLKILEINFNKQQFSTIYNNILKSLRKNNI